VFTISLAYSLHGQLYNASSNFLCCSDDTECVSYVDLDDVRGFLVGGFAALGNRDGDLSHVVRTRFLVI